MRTKLILSAILLSAAIGVPAAVLAGDDEFRRTGSMSPRISGSRRRR